MSTDRSGIVPRARYTATVMPASAGGTLPARLSEGDQESLRSWYYENDPMLDALWKAGCVALLAECPDDIDSFGWRQELFMGNRDRTVIHGESFRVGQLLIDGGRTTPEAGEMLVWYRRAFSFLAAFSDQFYRKLLHPWWIDQPGSTVLHVSVSADGIHVAANAT